MAGLLERMFSGEKRILNRLEKTADEVMALADSMASLSDDELRGKTDEFKKRYRNGESLDDLKVEAFAVAREAAKRTIGEYPYKVQIMGAAAMHEGDIAEMKTGEGKTLTSTMCVYLNALSGEGVHVVTVNEYLAQRDAEWMGQIYRFLGLSVGFNARAMSAFQKREAYACDITYTTNSELGFDYLRDNMVTDVKDRVMRGLHVAIVDEVDSILIDESRTPLIISGGAKKTANLYLQADAFAKRLKSDGYEIDEKTKQIMLTESGVEKAERYFKLDNLYDVDHTQLVHHITQALKANYIMKNEVEYVVQDDEIVIVDTFTGRTMPGRAYSDGLHQAIEAKEGVPIKEETSTLATITYQNFFRLYDKLAGMTGTAKTEEEEFLDIYNMRVIEIPTNRPVQRQDLPDAIFAKPALKFNALIEEVKRLYDKGQPVLVGTISVEASELVHNLLVKAKIPHEVLNAKNHAREAEIIAKAGQVKAVTVATNMAGRGTDIKLSEESRALGGLAVLGSERHESRRIDNQLRGRSGRQGDPGFSRFYVSLQDELMIRFGGDKFKNLFETLGDAQIESKMVTKSITQAQKRVEGYNYDVRKQLLDYDDVLRKQREIMYEQRNYVLENEDVHGIVRDMMDRVVESVVMANVDASKHNEVDYESVIQGLEMLGVTPEQNIKVEEIRGKSSDETASYCAEKLFQLYDDKIKDFREEFKRFEKNIVLRNMDRNWIEHIDMMDKLRNGIHLRAYAQNNPLQAYIEEGYEMFEEMQQRIAREVVFFAMKLEIQRTETEA
ncbi:preprotein translocase subunit SecA [Amedibacterium intestinale]|uniref:preprotein translocase subunit SecA n=1 Tax=Amedibacterium intestinale TaxID=2583452 RepID=UPI003992D447